jgi:hypothetical protein
MENIHNEMIEYKEEMIHVYLKDNKNAPISDWSVGSQSLASLLMRVPLSLNDKKIGMGYLVDNLPKYCCKDKLDK